MRVPRPMRLASGRPSCTVNEPPADDSQMYCSSWLCLDVTTTLLGDEVRRVEADAELADHVDVGARLHRLHERLGARLARWCRGW